MTCLQKVGTGPGQQWLKLKHLAAKQKSSLLLAIQEVRWLVPSVSRAMEETLFSQSLQWALNGQTHRRLYEKNTLFRNRWSLPVSLRRVSDSRDLSHERSLDRKVQGKEENLRKPEPDSKRLSKRTCLLQVCSTLDIQGLSCPLSFMGLESSPHVNAEGSRKSSQCYMQVAPIGCLLLN